MKRLWQNLMILRKIDMKNYKQYIESTGQYINSTDDFKGNIELEIISGRFKGCKFYYGGSYFKDGENPDGSKTFVYEKHITNNFLITVDSADEFSELLGDILLELIEEGIEKNTVVFRGGV